MKKVLITGHGGYIGALMVPYFARRGYEVVGLDTGFFSGCEFYETHDAVSVIRKDVRDVVAEDLEGVDAVCHLAALSNDPLGALAPEMTERVNHEATLHVARCARAAGARKFVFASSCSIYGVAEDRALTEDAAMNPQTAYARAKEAAERGLLEIGEADFEVCFLRNGTAYGVSPMHRTDLVLNNLVGWACLTGSIRIMSDGTPWRPIVHIEDICNAFWAAVTAPDGTVGGQAFNVGRNEDNHQIRTMAEAIRACLPDTEITYTGEHGSDSRTYNVSFDKIRRVLPAFRPVWDLEKGIRELHEAYAKHGLRMEDFDGRRFVRLKQLRHLMDSGKVDGQLVWVR